MRILRFNAQGTVKYGVLEDNDIRGMQGSPFTQWKGPGSSFKLDGSTYKLNEVKLLAPCTPSKVLCVGGNHINHTRDADKSYKIPLMFDKPSTAVVGPDDTILLPPEANNSLAYEGELAVVIGKRATDVPEEKWREYVLGYTCHNDVAIYGFLSGSHTRGKGYDTFAPIGPWIETDLDPDDVIIETRINGKIAQHDSTKGIIAKVPRLIHFFTSAITLLPGDVLSTGTPGKMGEETGEDMNLKPGDVVELEIDKIGTLRNYVANKK